MYLGLSRHAYFITFSFCEFLDFIHFLYLFLVYTVEPCYKAPFMGLIIVSRGLFPLLEKRWKLGKVEKNKGGFELGEGKGHFVSCFAAPGWKRSCHWLPRCWGSDYSDAPLYFKT